MGKLASLAYLLVMGGSVAISLLFASQPEGAQNTSLLHYAVGGFVASIFISLFTPGHKTRLQLFFLSVGSLVALATYTLSWGGWGLFGVGICLFMVATMKLDGGDRD